MLIQPKAPIPVNKGLVANRIPSCGQMPQPRCSLDPGASFGGICGPRFTAPKYLGSMVRVEAKNLARTWQEPGKNLARTWIVPTS
jgi:hypothetical protein